MKKTRWVMVLLALAAASAWSQRPAPEPDKNGVYPEWGGVKPARLVHAAPAAYPADPGSAGLRHVSALNVVIGIDGSPAAIEVASRAAGPFDDAAIAAVRQSTFEPGKLGGSPVPVRIAVWVPFLGSDRPALPMAGRMKETNITPPAPTKWVEAEFSDEARRKKVDGIVLVSLVVTEDGLSTNAQVIRSVGYGLDQKALEAVRQYRFKPATLEGVRVAVPITVEVSFKLYRKIF